MALQAAWVYMAAKVCGAIDVVRTVDPLVSVRPITYRKFKELIAGPIQIRLASHTRAGNDVDPLAQRQSLCAFFGNCGLKVVAVSDVHLEKETRIKFRCRRILDHE